MMRRARRLAASSLALSRQQQAAQISTSSPLLVGGSGRFRKIKQQNAEYFQRSGEKKVTEHTNTVLDPDYLDAMVEKMLRGKHGVRLGFLKQRTHQNLPEEEVGLRKDVAREWNHIYETVRDLGVPEMADVIGGQVFAGGNARATCTTALAIQLADNLHLLTNAELWHIIAAMRGWPGDASSSESLNRVLTSIDGLAAERCPAWEEEERLELALTWAAYPFRPSQSSFVRTCLMLSGPSLPLLSLPSLLHYLLLVSYRADDKLLVLGNFVGIDELEGAARTLDTEFHRLTETEVAVAYSALRHLNPEVAKGLGVKIHQTFGFRL